MKPAFIRAQTHKLNAAKIPEFSTVKSTLRMWGPLERLYEVFGRDVEMEMWGELIWTGCQLKMSFRRGKVRWTFVRILLGSIRLFCMNFHIVKACFSVFLPNSLPPLGEKG